MRQQSFVLLVTLHFGGDILSQTSLFPHKIWTMLFWLYIFKTIQQICRNKWRIAILHIGWGASNERQGKRDRQTKQTDKSSAEVQITGAVAQPSNNFQEFIVKLITDVKSTIRICLLENLSNLWLWKGLTFLCLCFLLLNSPYVAGVTILLSLTIFLNTVSEIIPITSDSPLIGRHYFGYVVDIIICLFLGTYFNCIMFMVASSVVTTIMILNLHHRLPETHSMPFWVGRSYTTNRDAHS